MPGRTKRISGRNIGFAVLVLSSSLFLAASSLLSLSPIGSALANDVQKRGEKLFRNCKNCHEVGENARNLIGPHLDGLFGRTAGSLDKFKYSSAIKARGAEGLVWDEASLDQYLEKPAKMIPGTRMSYRGMADAQDRTDLIAYLKSVSEGLPAADPARPPQARSEMGAAAMALDGDPDYGEYLSSECVTCHQITGRADGIPSIIGWPKVAFIRALFEYKTNVRSHQVMQNMTTNLGNEEIASLAAYFGSIDPK